MTDVLSNRSDGEADYRRVLFSWKKALLVRETFEEEEHSDLCFLALLFSVCSPENPQILPGLSSKNTFTSVGFYMQPFALMG